MILPFIEKFLSLKKMGRSGKNFSGGFTLIELLVVTFILSILVAIVVGFLGQSRMKGRDARRQKDAHEIRTALNLYYTDRTNFPTDVAGSEIIIGGENDYLSEELVSGKYIAKVSRDPINNAVYFYSYKPLQGAQSYELRYRLENTEREIILGP